MIVPIVFVLCRGRTCGCEFYILAIIPEGVVVATNPEGVVVATNPEGVVVAIIPEGVVVAIIPEGVVVATNPEGVVVATTPEGVVVAIIPEGVVVATTPEGVVGATTPEGVVVANTPEGVVVMFDRKRTPISNEYYVVKQIFTYSILICSYYIISKHSISITFNTFLCFDTFIVRSSILTKAIKEYAKSIAIDSPC